MRRIYQIENAVTDSLSGVAVLDRTIEQWPRGQIANTDWSQSVSRLSPDPQPGPGQRR